MRAAFESDWHRRDDADHWLAGAQQNLQFNLELEDVATFVWAIACSREWRESDEMLALYALASKRVHHLPKAISAIRSVVAPTVSLYSVHGSERLEAEAALGFALRAGRKGHSVRPWRPIQHAICRAGLGRAEKVLRSEKEVRNTTDDYFKNITSRLNTAKQALGCQLAFKRDPGSASKRDPPEGRVLTSAHPPSELFGRLTIRAAAGSVGM